MLRLLGKSEKESKFETELLKYEITLEYYILHSYTLTDRVRFVLKLGYDMLQSFRRVHQFRLVTHHLRVLSLQCKTRSSN